MREALATFPNQAIADRALSMYFQENGEHPDDQRLWYRMMPMFNHNTKETSITADMAVLGAYAETYLAKQRAGSTGIVGMNLLTELDRPNMHELLGAMMAGVDFVGMGAGIPDQIPRVIHDIRHGAGAPVGHNVHVRGKGDVAYEMMLNPERYAPDYAEMSDPAFLAIITHHVLAQRLSRNDYAPDGYVIEAPTAGGHNEPARGRDLNERGEPIYGERDIADLQKMQDMGLTYWLAGSRASNEDYMDAILQGARGVQVGTAFALTQESGWDPELKQQVLNTISREDGLDVYTDTLASPTGFPLKIGRVPRTMAERAIYEARERICDLGYLRQAHNDPDRPGKIEYVCPSEPIDDYLRKKTGLSKDEIADIVALRESTADGDLSLLLKDASIEDLTKTHIRKFLIAEGQTEGRIH